MEAQNSKRGVSLLLAAVLLTVGSSTAAGAKSIDEEACINDKLRDSAEYYLCRVLAEAQAFHSLPDRA
jgi:hypothetical protein